MPSSTYEVKYKNDVAKAIADNQALAASYLQVEQAASRAQSAVAKAAAAARRSATNQAALTAAVNALTAALSANQAQTGQATTAAQANAAANRAAAAAANSAALGNRAAATAARASAAATGSATTNSNALGLSFNKLLIAGIALKGFKIIFGEMGDAIRKAREEGERTADGALDKRHKARELSALMGEDGPNDRVLARIFRVSLASGLGFDESVKFLEQAEGSAPVGVKKGNMREDQKAEVFAEGARASERFGIDAATGGDLAGVISQHLDLNNQVDAKGNKMTAKEVVAGQIEALVHGANEGRGKVTTLVRAELAQAANAVSTGRVGSLPEMGAWIGTASTTAKTGAFAGTAFSQVDALLNRTAEEPGGDFLKESGIADEKGDLAKIKKLKATIDAAAGGDFVKKKFDANKFLAEKGFSSQAERKSTVGLMTNLDVLEKNIAEENARAKDGKGAISRNDQFQTSLDAQNQKSKNREDAAEYLQGREKEVYMIAVRNASARLRQQGVLTDAEQVFADSIKNGLKFNEFRGAKPELRNRIDAEIAREATTNAANAGINLEGEGKAYKENDGTPLLRDPEKTVKDLHDRGVDVFGGDSGIGAQMLKDDKTPAQRAAMDAAMNPKVKAGINPAGPGAGAGAAPKAGPQASIDASDLKDAAAALKGAAGDLKALASASGGGSRGRGGRDYGEPSDFSNPYGPHRPGSYS